MSYLDRKELFKGSKERWDVPVVVIQDDGKEYAFIDIKMHGQKCYIHMIEMYDRSLWIDKVWILLSTLTKHIDESKRYLKGAILREDFAKTSRCDRKWLNPEYSGATGIVASFIGKLYKDVYYGSNSFPIDCVFEVASCHESVRFQISDKDDFKYIMEIMNNLLEALNAYYLFLLEK